MFRATRTCAGIGTRLSLHTPNRYSSSKTKTTDTNKESNVSACDESYRQLDNLDFPTAAKILFSDPPKKKKFGLDFHLVQLFFACMPSFAVFLVAQYARYEIRRMEAELDEKKRKEEEEKGKEMELKEAEEQAKRESDPVILKVKERLDQLEETVKEIVADSRKQSDGAMSKRQQYAKAVEAKGTTKSSSSAKQKPPEQTLGSDQDRGKVTSASDSSVEREKYNNQKDEPTKESKK